MPTLLVGRSPRYQTAEFETSDISTQTLFTVSNGIIAITSLIGEVTTAIENTLNNVKIEITGGASPFDFCAVVDVDNQALGVSLTLSGTPADALRIDTDGVTGSQAGRMLCGIGNLRMNCSATTTGKILWTCRWHPMEEGAYLRAA